MTVTRIAGELTDHYDPKENVIRLSQSVYDARTAAAVGVAAHEAGHKVIVVICNETAVTIQNWVDSADAILMMYHSGQRGGVATANLLSGVVNPSGKLAYVMPKEGNQTVVTYSEEQFNKQEMAVAGANLLLDSDSLDIRQGEADSELAQHVLARFGRNAAFSAGIDGTPYWQVRDLREIATGAGVTGISPLVAFAAASAAHFA